MFPFLTILAGDEMISNSHVIFDVVYCEASDVFGESSSDMNLTPEGF